MSSLLPSIDMPEPPIPFLFPHKVKEASRLRQHLWHPLCVSFHPGGAGEAPFVLSLPCISAFFLSSGSVSSPPKSPSHPKVIPSYSPFLSSHCTSELLEETGAASMHLHVIAMDSVPPAVTDEDTETATSKDTSQS